MLYGVQLWLYHDFSAWRLSFSAFSDVGWDGDHGGPGGHGSHDGGHLVWAGGGKMGLQELTSAGSMLDHCNTEGGERLGFHCSKA